MCLICVELTKNKLTAAEARRNMGEMRVLIEADHRIDVLKAIWKKESEEEQQHEDSWGDDWGADDNWDGGSD